MFEIFRSSIGKKLVVAITGLFLIIFLIVHLLGNLLLFKADDGVSFDRYSKALENNPFIWFIEIVLVLAFTYHIVTATTLWIHNKHAQPVKYAINKASKSSTLSSRIVFLTGSIVLIFLALHLWSFTFQGRFFPEASEPSMYRLVRSAFSNIFYDSYYIFSITLLGFHLKHGFQSALQTLGIRHKKYLPIIKTFGAVFWLLIPLGFISMPVYFLLNL